MYFPKNQTERKVYVLESKIFVIMFQISASPYAFIASGSTEVAAIGVPVVLNYVIYLIQTVKF